MSSLTNQRFATQEACGNAIEESGLTGKYKPCFLITSTDSYFYAKKRKCITCGNALDGGNDAKLCHGCEMDRSHRWLWGSGHP
jgi:hypothetical protein